MPKTFDPSTEIPDLAGKVILVTGGNSGLGAASIKQFAKHKPAELWLAARTRATAESTAKAIEAETPGARISILDLDLGSLASVRAAAERFLAATSRLDLLMLNAGIAATPPGLSADGYELQFGTNYVGHALFAQLLMPRLLETAASSAAADVRLVVLGSKAHNFAPAGGLHLDRAKTDMASNMGMVRYGHSKLPLILWVRSLAARYARLKIVAVDPGTVDTGLVRGGAQAHPWLGRLAKPIMRMVGQTADAGARNQLWASVSADIKSGEYYEPIGKDGVASADAKNDKLAAELWEWTDAELKQHGGPGWPAAE